MERAVGVAGLQRPLDGEQLVAELLEPQLVDLVDDDEQQLIVLGLPSGPSTARPGARAAPGP